MVDVTRLRRGRAHDTQRAIAAAALSCKPIGVVSIITPGKFPLQIVSQKLPFALAAGCTCVVKSSEMTSASTLHLGSLLSEAGVGGERPIPDGLFMTPTIFGRVA
jgi:acyl-CoA reductase-like NAD-dependent aldehyde dehydrogenase